MQRVFIRFIVSFYNFLFFFSVSVNFSRVFKYTDRMPLLCFKHKDLSWQDRTINIEFMIAPARSQLLYNKHKGLKTKYDQVSHNLDKEKESYMRSYKTDQRLMERKKETFSKRRNDIIQKRAMTDYLGRRRSSLPINFPNPQEDNMFITSVPTRESQSAGPRIHFQSQTPITPILREPSPDRTKHLNPITPDIRGVSACSTPRSATPGKPFLQREKTVHFDVINTNMDCNHVCEHIKSRIVFNVSIEDRIKQFLDKQHHFNTNPAPTKLPRLSRDLSTDSKRSSERKQSTVENLNLVNLESAFDEFCADDSADGLQKLVKYASKMKASARIARHSIISPIN